MRTDQSYEVGVAVAALLATALLCALPVRADPVTAPASKTAPSKDEVAAAIKALESERPSPSDFLETDATRDAAAAMKANAEKRAAVAGVGAQPQKAAGANNNPQASGPVSNSSAPFSAALQGGGIVGANAPLDAQQENRPRPVYENRPGLGDALGGLKADLRAELFSERDRNLEGGATQTGSGAYSSRKPSEGAAESGDDKAWASPVERSNQVESGNAVRTAQQVKMDQMMAVAYTEKLKEELKPWAIAAALLAVVALIARIIMRYMRNAEEKRRRRMFANSAPPPQRSRTPVPPRKQADPAPAKQRAQPAAQRGASSRRPQF